MLANNQYVWSPQYVMHKTIMGLTAAYEEGGNEQALTVLDQLADWYLRWTEEMLTRNPHAIYSGEEGGMLEAWARLYQLTGEEKYHTLTERYSDPGLFRKLLAGQDGLTNCHANASIPLSHGAARLYEITGEDKWKEITEAFWQEAVEKRGMYATTGQNAGEFWIPPHMQGRHLGDRTQEFCTVYNMVRTASYLYRWTGVRCTTVFWRSRTDRPVCRLISCHCGRVRIRSGARRQEISGAVTERWCRHSVSTRS